MEEIEIKGRTYTIKKLPVMQQFHVMRRMAPILAAFVDGIPSGADIANSMASFDLTKIGEEIAALSDKDSEYILNTCLGAVLYRDPEAERDFKIQVRPGVMAYEFIELPEILQLTGAVIKLNLSGFMAAVPSATSDKGAA